MATKSVTLVRDGKERTVSTPSDIVQLRYDGWTDKPAGKGGTDKASGGSPSAQKPS